MPIKYTVSEDGLLIETYVKGDLDIESTLDYFNRLANDKRIKPEATEVVYFIDISEFKISVKQGQMMAKRYMEPKSFIDIEKTIFVGGAKFEFEVGRMIQTYHQMVDSGHNVAVVESFIELDTLLKGPSKI